MSTPNTNAAATLLRLASAVVAGNPLGLAAIAVGQLALDALAEGRDLTKDQMDEAWAILDLADQEADDAIARFRARQLPPAPERN